MYQRAEICLPRKKRVPDTFHSNTYRIFDERLPERLPSCKAYKEHSYPRRSSEECSLNKTHNIPQPRNVRFIRTNVRWLNEPIAHVETETTADDQCRWWPNGYDQSVARAAPYRRDSVQQAGLPDGRARLRAQHQERVQPQHLCSHRHRPHTEPHRPPYRPG
ncbi:hypothetical protein AAFF_G00075310 [Aldrovandia affinis]|uniref:Uncharacterized protein n=1 Tax=Aldrovandia affinis TaxID=143900 RepID=A0AAD7S0K6_9TELE|nr:hypothetical protein AAFF_G00075310 [Aldrovandia affinis]